MLTIADVSKSYGTRELFADVSLFIARTDRLGLVGPNGAGKSTLFGPTKTITTSTTRSNLAPKKSSRALASRKATR